MLNYIPEVIVMNSPLLEKSLDFATQIVLFYEAFSKSRKDTTIAKQLLRSATSIGANINEAVYGNSKADFISKLHIALKETGESIYWLTLLSRTGLIDYDFTSLLALAEEIKRMLIASLNTAKNNM
jgi:four helix bundle protein